MQKQKGLARLATAKGISTLVGIIIIIAIAVVVFGGVFAYQYFATRTNKQPQVQSNQQNQNQQQQTVNQQTNNIQPVDQATGIIITSLKPNDAVKLPITIEGYLDGHGWTANEGEVGVVQVFDLNGRSVSNQEIIKTTTDWLKFPTYFKAIVGDREMMSNITTNSGFVKIISSGAKNGEQIKSISIPIKFTK